MKKMFRHLQMQPKSIWLGLAATALLLAACASIRFDAEWSNPELAAYKIGGKVLVVGLTRDDTARRLYEDALTAQLTTRGTAAVQGYESFAGPPSQDGNRPILQAARRIGAGAILTSAVVGHEHVERVIVDPFPRRSAFFDAWYGDYWPYVHSEVRIAERYVIGTSLTDVGTGKVVWSARTTVEASDNPAREINALAKAIVDNLVAKGML